MVFGGYNDKEVLNDLYVLNTSNLFWYKPKFDNESNIPSKRERATYSKISD